MNLQKNLIAYQTLVSKEITRIFRIWPQSLLPTAITMTLYFLIFGKLIGSQIHAIDNFTYMQYLMPGLVMMSVITNSYVHASSAFFGMKFQKSIEEILISPMPNFFILAGFITGALVRAVMTATIVVIIGLFFTKLTILHFGLMLFIIVLTAIFFALTGLINAIYAKTFDDVSWIPTFVITPLTYLGGVFFSLNMLPPFWKTIALFNPVLYIIDTFRFSMMGLRPINITHALILLSILTIALFCFTLRLLKTSKQLRN